MNRITRTAVRFLSFVMLAGLLAPDAGATPVPGAVLWVDASTLAGADGSTVSNLANLGTGGGTFSSGSCTLNTSGINGKKALEFDGTDDYLRSTTAYANSGNVLTMFVVTKRISNNGNGKGVVSCVKYGWADWNHPECFFVDTSDSAGKLALVRSGTPGYVVVDHQSAIGTPFISTAVFTGSAGILYIKTSESSYNGSFASSNNFEMTTTALGCRQEYTASYFNNINIGEVLIYNSALSDTDRLAVESYLAVKWWGVKVEGTALIVR